MCQLRIRRRTAVRAAATWIGLYTRLDAERARVKDGYRAALRGPIDQMDGGTLVARDAEVRALAKQIGGWTSPTTDSASAGWTASPANALYIGRIGILDKDNEYEPLLLDWRAPAARAFYVATAATPENMRRRRQFHTRGRRIVDFTDEVLGRPEWRMSAGMRRLLAAVNAPRGEGMRDIVATIQAEQDEIIRLDHPGVLVIEGGPGTGKTVVALHRVAYLLYTQRKRIGTPRRAGRRAQPGVPEPHRPCSAVAGRVRRGVHDHRGPRARPARHRRRRREAARLKGSLKMLDVLAAAVADRQRLPKDPMPIELADVTVRIDAETAEWAREEARASGKPHNEARAVSPTSSRTSSPSGR